MSQKSTLKYIMNKQYLTVEEVAKRLRVNMRTVYRMAVKGEIPAFKFGKSWRIDAEKLDEYIKDNLKR